MINFKSFEGSLLLTILLASSNLSNRFKYSGKYEYNDIVLFTFSYAHRVSMESDPNEIDSVVHFFFEAETPVHDQADDLSKGCEITWFTEKSDIRKPKSIKRIRNNNTNRFASDSRHCDASNTILVMFNNAL